MPLLLLVVILWSEGTLVVWGALRLYVSISYLFTISIGLSNDFCKLKFLLNLFTNFISSNSRDLLLLNFSVLHWHLFSSLTLQLVSNPALLNYLSSLSSEIPSYV